MAVIWEDDDVIQYITPGGWPPSKEDIDLARQYDTILRAHFNDIEKKFKASNFFSMKNGLSKWYLLGTELQFLDTLEIVSKCDPDLENTWRHLYDIVPELTPTGKLPGSKRRAFGVRNHFYIAYRVAKIPWAEAKKLRWSSWREILMSFTPEMWSDYQRLINWLIYKIDSIDGNETEIMLQAVKAMRHISGKYAVIRRHPNYLQDDQLTNLLDEEYEKIVRK